MVYGKVVARRCIAEKELQRLDTNLKLKTEFKLILFFRSKNSNE